MNKEKLVKKINKLKEDAYHWEGDAYDSLNRGRDGYIEALNDVLEILK